MRSCGFLGLVALTICAGSSGANLLVNGDFSQWESPVQPSGWTVEDTTKARIERCGDTVRSVPYACRITRLVAGTGNNSGIRQFVPVDPGRVYTFSAWYFDDDVNARGGLVITWCRGDSTALKSTPVIYTDSSIHTWQRLVRSDTAPDSTVYAKCLLRVYGFTGGPAGGVVYVDDADFSEGAGGVGETEGWLARGRGLNVAPIQKGAIRISLTVNNPLTARLRVYNLLGMECAEIWRGVLAPGTHLFFWEGNNRPPGVYFVLFENDAGVRTVQKFVLER